MTGISEINMKMPATRFGHVFTMAAFVIGSSLGSLCAEEIDMVMLKIEGERYAVRVPREAVQKERPEFSQAKAVEKCHEVIRTQFKKGTEFKLVSESTLRYKEGVLYCLIFEKGDIRAFGTKYDLPETIYCYVDVQGNVYFPKKAGKGE